MQAQAGGLETTGEASTKLEMQAQTWSREAKGETESSCTIGGVRVGTTESEDVFLFTMRNLIMNIVTRLRNYGAVAYIELRWHIELSSGHN